MAKSKKAKARAGARKKTAAKGRHAPKVAAKGRAKAKAGRPRQLDLKAKPAKPLAKAAAPAKVAGKIPQRMDKAALKKALLDERIARAQAQAKGKGKGKGGRRSTRGLTAKEKALVKEFERRELSPADAEARRTRLKNLIVLGKERSYLTYAEINDHLPENIVDPEAIEGIIGTFNDMGIAVYEHAPDAETLLLSDNVASVTSDDEAEAAAEAALSTVDSDFGRTTDPVRMYMREMGTVDLLTREGEIKIAKRIEEGITQILTALS
ncbi:MAG TPA: RNA polymerase sigma factor region1.1 domain-containing protein, partial [Burkholderiales bacterium]